MIRRSYLRHWRRCAVCIALISSITIFFFLRCDIENLHAAYSSAPDGYRQLLKPSNTALAIDHAVQFHQGMRHSLQEANYHKQPDGLLMYESSRGANISGLFSALTGKMPLNNEFEVAQFTRFTLDRLYPFEPGLGRRVIEKPIGYRKQEILAVLNYAITVLNEEHTAKSSKYSVGDFIEGIYKTVPDVGTYYELFFRNQALYRKIAVALPYAMPVVMSSVSLSPRKDSVHVILSLSGRMDAFYQFLKRFEQIFISDNGITLTVVCFGQKDLSDVRSAIAEVKNRHILMNIKLLKTDGRFSRSRGLQIGVESIQNVANPLLFLCDVDIAFTSGFLERCRLHSSAGHGVYYPIVFSLYNPTTIAELNGTVPSIDHPISRDSGFWRDFGYGMTCQYRSDFLNIGGFKGIQGEGSSPISGWGLEDVLLYRRHLQSGHVAVIRATDPGIFHIWHEKVCDSTLPSDQYSGCLRSKALSEASHSQLGMLLFRTRATSQLPLHTSNRKLPVDLT